MKNRYSKNHQAITTDEQKTLAQKNATIVGCGGLGQNIAHQLTRIGVGSLRIIDNDCFDETNLNRQLFSHTQNLGKSKVIETQQQLNRINPDVKIDAHQTRFTAENAHSLLSGSDVVIDALDSIKDRLTLEKACNSLNTPLISAAIGGWYGHIIVVNPGDNTLQKLYSDHDEICTETLLGNPAFTPALLASLQTAETVKILLGKQTIQKGKMLYIDLLEMKFITL